VVKFVMNIEPVIPGVKICGESIFIRYINSILTLSIYNLFFSNSIFFKLNKNCSFLKTYPHNLNIDLLYQKTQLLENLIIHQTQNNCSHAEIL